MSKKNRLKKIGKRLASYSAAAAATAVVTGTANAGEIIWDIPDITSDNTTDVRFNLVSGGVVAEPATSSHYQARNTAEGSFGFGWFGQYLYAPAGDTGGGMQGAWYGTDFFSVTGGSRSAYVDSGVNLGGDAGWMPTYGLFGYVGYLPSSPVGVGLKFTLNGNTHYGWAAISSSGGDATLHAFGYNDTPGARSHVAVPEPSSLLLLAAGAAGLAFWRKRRPALAA